MEVIDSFEVLKGNDVIYGGILLYRGFGEGTVRYGGKDLIIKRGNYKYIKSKYESIKAEQKIFAAEHGCIFDAD